MPASTEAGAASRRSPNGRPGHCRGAQDRAGIDRGRGFAALRPQDLRNRPTRAIAVEPGRIVPASTAAGAASRRSPNGAPGLCRGAREDRAGIDRGRGHFTQVSQRTRAFAGEPGRIVPASTGPGPLTQVSQRARAFAGEPGNRAGIDRGRGVSPVSQRARTFAGEPGRIVPASTEAGATSRRSPNGARAFAGEPGRIVPASTEAGAASRRSPNRGPTLAREPGTPCACPPPDVSATGRIVGSCCGRGTGSQISAGSCASVSPLSGKVLPSSASVCRSSGDPAAVGTVGAPRPRSRKAASVCMNPPAAAPGTIGPDVGAVGFKLLVESSIIHKSCSARSAAGRPAERELSKDRAESFGLVVRPRARGSPSARPRRRRARSASRSHSGPASLRALPRQRD